MKIVFLLTFSWSIIREHDILRIQTGSLLEILQWFLLHSEQNSSFYHGLWFLHYVGSSHFSSFLCWAYSIPPHPSTQCTYDTTPLSAASRYQALLPPPGIGTCCSLCLECFPSPLFQRIGTFL